MEVNRTLILNNKKDKDFKAVLNIKDDLGLIRFYNLTGRDKKYALGIRQNDEVIKIPLQIDNEGCKFNLPKELKSEDKVFCAVVDVSNAFCPEIVLSGSSNSVIQNSSIENAFVQSKPQDPSTLYEVEEGDEIEKIVDKNLNDDLNSVYYDSCANCRYRKAFYEGGACLESCVETKNAKSVNGLNVETNCKCYQGVENCIDESYSTSNLGEEKQFATDKSNEFCPTATEEKAINLKNGINDENSLRDTEQNVANASLNANNSYDDLKSDQDAVEELEEEPATGKNPTFYEQIRGQIEALFKKYDRDEVLEQTVSQSQWVKVTYDNQDEYYYVLGLIYADDGENVSYIAYGVPSNDMQNPPDDIKEFAQWLPVNADNWLGYWIVYQDANDGETIEVDFD